MRYLSRFLLIFLLPLKLNATGFPIFDGQELINQISDATYLLSSIHQLLNEADGTASGLQMVSKLSSEVSAFEQQIRAYEELSGAAEDASNPVFQKSRVLSDQIDSVTNHVRKLKRLLVIAGGIARPQALNTTLQMLENERQREREKFEVAFKAIEEQEKIYKLRRELEARSGFKRSLDSELDDIRSFSRNSNLRPIGLKSRSRRKSAGVGLW